MYSISISYMNVILAASQGGVSNDNRSNRCLILRGLDSLKMHAFWGCIAFAVGSIFLVIPADAEDFVVGDLLVSDAWVRVVPKSSRATAGYFVVRNTGDTVASLIGVRSDFPRVMIHNSKKEDGVMKMFHVDAVEIPAGGTVNLEPGGYHIMFMGLDGSGIEEGSLITATLVFDGVELPVSFQAKKIR